MQTHPGVTAVVPTHNRPEPMRRAVESILNQDYVGQIEVIVVFDASEPELPDVKIPPGRTLRALRNERTRGLAGARNTGIINATHHLVASLDDDDEWLKTKLTRQIRLLQRSPGAIMVGTAMVIDQNGQLTERPVPCNPVTHPELLRDRMAGLHSSSFIFRRQRFMDLGMVDEDLPWSYGEDYDLLLRVAQVATIPVVNEPLVKVGWSEPSYFFGKWAQYAEALSYLRDKHPEFGTDPKSIGRLESQIAFALAAAGDRSDARGAARRALSADMRQVKAYLAVLISLRLLSAGAVTKVARKLGKGI